jgi:osmoprotectant transport system permease protein
VTDQSAPDVGAATASHRRRTLAGYLFIPAIVAVALLGLAVWVAGQDLDSIERRRVSLEFIIDATLRHLQLTIVSTALVLLIAVPVGVLLTRPFARRLTPPTIAVFNIGVAIPSIGLLALFAVVWEIGFWPAVVALVAYAALPVLRNTMVGLQQVDPTVIESARGMGMGRLAVLLRIEFPLAVPVILAGVRTALVINVGTAALATFVAAGGLGEIIVTGLVQNRQLVTTVGAVLTACVALLVDYLAGLAEDVLRPRGL